MESPVTFFTAPVRKWLCRIVFSGILLSLLYSYFSQTLLHQLCRPVLRYPYVDPSYWLMTLSGIPAFLTHYPVIAGLFDAALFGTCLLVLIRPERRLYIGIFLVLYAIYFFTFNLYGNLHTGGKVGILLAPVPFLAADLGAFTLLWEGLRYFTLFIYADAFLWKLFRGTWLYGEQGVRIIRENLAPYLTFNPDTSQAHVYYWFLQHPGITDAFFKTGFILEGLFLTGFFTRRFDRYLLIISFLLPVGFFVFADAFFFELLILSLTLMDRKVYGKPLPFAGRPDKS